MKIDRVYQEDGIWKGDVSAKGNEHSIEDRHFSPFSRAAVIWLGTNDCVTGVWNQANFIAGLKYWTIKK
jgi:hypothetical protein